MIPSEVKLKRALLLEIYGTKNHCAIPKNIYEQLVVHFEKELDDSDFELYANGIQKWVTAVQFARNRLKDEKLILSPKEHKPREWKLSEEGIKVARKISVEDFEMNKNKLEEGMKSLKNRFAHDLRYITRSPDLESENENEKEDNFEVKGDSSDNTMRISNVTNPCENVDVENDYDWRNFDEL